MSELLYEVRDAVAVLTLNRPERMNAWTPGLELLLRERFAQAEADPEARAILLTGAGRAFCAGADMDAVAAEDGPDSTVAPPAVEGDFAQRYSYLMAGRKPLVCAINGGAAGVGFVLPLFADIRLVAEGAKLTTAFARRGLAGPRPRAPRRGVRRGRLRRRPRHGGQLLPPLDVGDQGAAPRRLDPEPRRGHADGRSRAREMPRLPRHGRGRRPLPRPPPRRLPPPPPRGLRRPLTRPASTRPLAVVRDAPTSCLRP